MMHFFTESSVPFQTLNLFSLALLNLTRLLSSAAWFITLQQRWCFCSWQNYTLSNCNSFPCSLLCLGQQKRQQQRPPQSISPAAGNASTSAKFKSSQKKPRLLPLYDRHKSSFHLPNTLPQINIEGGTFDVHDKNQHLGHKPTATYSPLQAS